MGAAYPVQGTFYFTVSVRHTAAGIRIVFAIYLGNLTVLVFLTARTFYDIGVLQTNFLSRCHPEIFLGSVFHEILTLHPQLTAELDRMAAGFRIFRVVDRFQLLHLSFRIVGDNQFHRIDHGGYTDGAGIQILAYGAFQQGELVQGVVSRITATIVYVAGIAFNYITAALEKRRVTSTFKKYVAPQIVQEILDSGNPEALMVGGRVVNIAVLFVDIRGFTTMSEKLSPSEVVEILNQYLTLIADCIMRNGGTLDKFIGDAAMAFWGAPLPQEDYVMKAVRAAEDMRQGSDELSKVLMEKYGRTVSFGIGVHVGDAVVGNIGSPQRMDYTAIGDTVNTSARLEANAPARTIFISREVADCLEGRIRVTSLGTSIKLKGKSDMEILTMDEILE